MRRDPVSRCMSFGEEQASLEKPFFNACAGRFSVVEAAIKAGVPPQNVFASDIGLFSSIIGYLADSSRKVDDLGIRILVLLC